MAYSTVDQVLVAFPPALTAVGAGSFDVSSANVFGHYIPAADSVIDSYLALKYTTPVSPAPYILTKLSCDLVIYDLFRDKALKVPDFMQERYDQAIEMLKTLAMGKMKLPGATEVSTGDNYAFSTGQGYHPVFSPVLEDVDQTVDTDFVEAELDERRDDYTYVTS